MSRFERWRRRVGARLASAGQDLQHVLMWHATDPAERLGLRPRWWRLPLCWWRGHRFGGESRGYFEISEHRAEFCRCCHAEVIGRTRWDELVARPPDDFNEYYWEED